MSIFQASNVTDFVDMCNPSEFAPRSNKKPATVGGFQGGLNRKRYSTTSCG